MKHATSLNAACECGSNQVKITDKPLARFICHCKICQSVYDRPFSDFIVLKASALRTENCQQVDFKRYKLPPALQRGKCVTCHQPVIAWLSLMGMVKLAFIPVFNLNNTADLPPPTAHLFYDRAIAPVADNIRKVEGFLASEWCVSKVLISGLMARPA